MQIRARASGPQALEQRLRAHPGVELESFSNGGTRVEFDQGGWRREAFQANASVDGPYGLPELMDNNPLVCADRASCPGPAATIALIGLGPLIRSGLLVEQPACIFSFEDNYDEVDVALQSMGWTGGVSCAGNPVDLGGCVTGTSLAVAAMPAGADELDELYEECFGRSFFVRRNTADSWTPDLVRGKSWAMYQLLLSPSEDGHAVLRTDVLTDADGKCGSSQLIHLMNIMAGFEEDLGLRD